jgi:hypothetical protein
VKEHGKDKVRGQGTGKVRIVKGKRKTNWQRAARGQNPDRIV